MHSEEPLLGHLYSHLAKFFGKCQKGPFLQIRSHMQTAEMELAYVYVYMKLKHIIEHMQVKERAIQC